MDPTAHTMLLLRRILSDEPYRELPSADLLSRYVSSGDETAFRVLVERHGSFVLRTARPVVGCTSFADEVFQQTFLQLVAASRAGRAPKSVGRWLGRTAYRIALNVARRESRARSREWRAAAPEARPFPPPEHAEMLRAVRSAVAALPERYRRVIELVYFDGLTHAEAAEVLGKPKGTVDSLVSRALGRLTAPMQRIGPPAVVLGAAAGSEVVLHRCVAAATSAVFAGLAPTTAIRVWSVGRLAALVTGGLSVVGVAVGIAWTGADRPRPAVGPVQGVPVARREVAQPPAPSLQDVNCRRASEIAPRLAEAMPPLAFGGAVRVAAVEAFDTRVRITLEARPAVRFGGVGERSLTDFVFDTHTREKWVYADPAADGGWKWVNPKEPIKVEIAPNRFTAFGADVVHNCFAILEDIPTDPRGPAEAAARDVRVREALADFLGRWLLNGDAAEPRDVRLTESGVGLFSTDGDVPHVHYPFNALVPPADGTRFRVIRQHGRLVRDRLSADGRRIDLHWGDQWLQRPPGWTPPASR